MSVTGVETECLVIQKNEEDGDTFVEFQMCLGKLMMTVETPDMDGSVLLTKSQWGKIKAMGDRIFGVK